MRGYFDLKMPRLTVPYRLPADEQEEHWRVADELPRFRHPDFGCVTGQSPISTRRCVEQIARYFRREFRYDFVQYSAEHPKSDTRAYIWHPQYYAGEQETVIGAAYFCWREWSDADPGWALAWIWFHPYERRKGRLSSAWDYFRLRFGDFFVEPPLSAAMEAFLRKHDVQVAWMDQESTESR
jgi:hypothetical protein